MNRSDAFWASGTFGFLYATLLDEAGASLWKQLILGAVLWWSVYTLLYPRKDTPND
jgi:hypothetical protein